MLPRFMFFVISFLVFAGCAHQNVPSSTALPDNNSFAPMQLTSSAFVHNAPIPSRYTCDGENISPPLSIAEVPENAKSLALIVDDPDAPTKTWVHWVAWNMDPAVREIPEQISMNNEGINDFGQPGYGGPCPPSGTHRYFFKLYALDTLLELVPTITKADLETAMIGHILASAEFIGTYQRK